MIALDLWRQHLARVCNSGSSRSEHTWISPIPFMFFFSFFSFWISACSPIKCIAFLCRYVHVVNCCITVLVIEAITLTIWRRKIRWSSVSIITPPAPPEFCVWLLQSTLYTIRYLWTQISWSMVFCVVSHCNAISQWIYSLIWKLQVRFSYL